MNLTSDRDATGQGCRPLPSQEELVQGAGNLIRLVQLTGRLGIRLGNDFVIKCSDHEDHAVLVSGDGFLPRFFNSKILT